MPLTLLLLGWRRTIGRFEMANNASMRISVGMNSITWPFRWAFWIFMLLLLSWTMAMAIGLYFHFEVWPDQGTEPFERSMNLLLQDAVSAGDIGPLGLNAAALTVRLSNLAYEAVFVWSGLESSYFLALAGGTPSRLDAGLYRWLISHATALEVAMEITRIYGAKLAMLAASLPLFFVAYFVAMIDGLTARYIRKQGGGRESAFLYHRSKWALVMLLGTFVVFLLLLPLSYSPRWLLPGVATALGLMARLQWAYYKKYL